ERRRDLPPVTGRKHESSDTTGCARSQTRSLQPWLHSSAPSGRENPWPHRSLPLPVPPGRRDLLSARLFRFRTGFPAPHWQTGPTSTLRLALFAKKSIPKKIILLPRRTTPV